MNTFHSSLYAVAIATCVICSLVMGSSSKQRSGPPLAFFVAYLALEALGFVFEWLMLHPTSPGKSLWLGLLMGLSFFVAPCLWLFARALTEDKVPSLSTLPAGHFIVVGLGLVLTLPLIHTAHWGPAYVDPDTVTPAHVSLFIHGTMLASAALFLCQVPYYLKHCLAILSSHTAHAKALFSNIQDKSLNTLRILILLVFTNWTVSLLRVFHCMLLGEDTGLGLGFTVVEVAVTLWALVAVMRQTVLFEAEDQQLIAGIFTADGEAGSSPKYVRSSLDAPTRERIKGKLNDALTHRQLFKDSQLSLRRLCEQLNENPHYVSQVINQDLGTSFYDLINSHRIEAAKTALLQDREKTILEIALDVGFNSKSTFNAAFRRCAQLTPSEYRNSAGALAP